MVYLGLLTLKKSTVSKKSTLSFHHWYIAYKIDHSDQICYIINMSNDDCKLILGLQ